jgi:hypothetical protein
VDTAGKRSAAGDGTVTFAEAEAEGAEAEAEGAEAEAEGAEGAVADGDGTLVAASVARTGGAAEVDDADTRAGLVSEVTLRVLTMALALMIADDEILRVRLARLREGRCAEADPLERGFVEASYPGSGASMARTL